MSRDIYNTFRSMNDFKAGGISETISAAFGNPVPPQKPSSTNSSFVKRLTNLKENAIGKDLFLTEAEMNEIEDQMASQSYSAMSYEEMIKEVDSMKSSMKSKDDDIAELRRRLNKCQSELDVREAGLNGIDKSLRDIYKQVDD
ncbi:hypothetical protein SteCoe_14333 [Stentor coeruleus]|uniref:Uncharacterized protein n=1 Tax=Stentor coeruleus TaxID=5963 RepID=A0A1R2C685_9CILI|nr:hypothetical protein SteCoe_14333 [Stentor coeruleus]